MLENLYLQLRDLSFVRFEERAMVNDVLYTFEDVKARNEKKRIRKGILLLKKIRIVKLLLYYVIIKSIRYMKRYFIFITFEGYAKIILTFKIKYIKNKRFLLFSILLLKEN